MKSVKLTLFAICYRLYIISCKKGEDGGPDCEDDNTTTVVFTNNGTVAPAGTSLLFSLLRNMCLLIPSLRLTSPPRYFNKSDQSRQVYDCMEQELFYHLQPG